MKPAETSRLYEKTCRARRMTPSQDEMELWHRHLRSFELRDVEAGIDAWFASEATDGDGYVKSRFLPAPAELKHLVIDAQKRRETAAKDPQDWFYWECQKCRNRCSGIHPRSLVREVGYVSKRPCENCGGEVRLIQREQA